MDIQKFRKLLRKREVKKKIFLSLTILGVSLTLFGFFGYFYSRAVLSFSRAPETSQPENRKPIPTKIVINDLKMNLDISEGRIVNNIWEISEKGSSHLNISANPGEGGNVIIYGHNKKIIFGSLPYIKIGATVQITTQDEKIHLYKVVSKNTVNPNDLTLLSPTNEETLTIYTCTGFLDSKRFVLVAKPLN